ncbi:Bromodomain containing protein [Trichomonas vaginalis G3]|uniref:Bromodomain containing protein n=1 Tax=Trichomonas vaginalis (strain ATCC PRA-98 / G3) TaxID=412133 RepID=A2FCD3_TRIV3|nr:bromodomain family [Trichomonas vaginalis G3]EAX97445.1 Bromodomain containing protein [Trichomonas vaginalis G3]KAI5552003.1 bromodomain family [Trichomonas vaginalis G3]|eukprot:XP_001310375.1 Bromodomain containing protein [Trichomonas vaginalis G3]
MSMSEPRRQACMKITRKLMKYPCARLFLHPVDTTGLTDYNDVIKSPQDLTSIYNRLLNKEYPTIESWEHDMVLLWYNCEKYNGHDSVPFLVAQCLNERYKTLREKYLVYDFMLWKTQVQKLEKQLDLLLSDPPAVTKNYFPTLNIGRQKNTTFREAEYQSLFRSISKLTSPADTLFFVNTFYKNEPQIPAHEDPLSVDLRSLTYDSLIELRKYTKKRCQEMGIKYE